MKLNFTEMTARAARDSQCGSLPGQFVENIIDNKRVRRHSLRTIVNSIFWLAETGAQCAPPRGRNMESKFHAWQTVYNAAAVTIFGNLNDEEFGVNCLIYSS